MKKTILISTMAVITVMLMNPMKSSANVWRVNNNPTYNQGSNVFAQLTTAIGDPNVNPDDTLYVEASGTSYGTILLNKRLTIIGTGYFLSDNSGSQQNQTSATIGQLTFQAGSSGSTVMGLRISDVSYSSIHFDNIALNSITITRCYIDYVLDFNNAAGVVYNNFVITKNYIGSGISHVSYAPGTFTGLIFTNNFVGTGGITFPGANFHGVVAQNISTGNLDIQSNIQFYNNIVIGTTIAQANNGPSNIYSNVFSATQPAWLSGGNNSFGVPSSTIFPTSGSPDKRYDPNPIGICAPCYQGSPGGTVELGMFGGNDPYILSGIPNIPTIYLLQAPANVPAGGTLPTTISTRSNN